MRVPFAILALLSGGSAWAQPSPIPSPDNEPIIVTGTRSNGEILTVDFGRVARQCDECRRTLALIEKLAQPYQVKRGEIRRDRETMVSSIAEHTRGSGIRRTVKIPDGAEFLDPMAGPDQANQDQAKRFIAKIPDHQRKDQNELAMMRRDVSGLVAAYLAQLEPIVIEAAESERKLRGASAVARYQRRASKPVGLDITGHVIRRLNARVFTIELPVPKTAEQRP